MNSHIKWKVSPIKFIINLCRVSFFEIALIVILNLYLATSLSIRPYYIRQIINNASISENYWSFAFVLPVCIYLIISVTNTIFTRVNDYVLNITLIPKFSELIIKQLIRDTLQVTDYHKVFQDKNGLAESMMNLMDFIPESIIAIFNKFTYMFFSIVIAILVLWSVGPVFSIILVIWVLFVSLVIVLSYRKISFFTQKGQNIKMKLRQNFLDILTNITQVKVLNSEKKEEEFLSDILSDNINLHKKTGLAHFWMWSLYGYSFVLILALNFLQLILKKEAGLISVGDFALVITINIIIFDCFWTIFRDSLSFVNALAKIRFSLDTISNILTSEKPVFRFFNNSPCNIVYDNVCLDIKEKNILKNITTSIKFGTKLGIIGESGSGKSTFVNLLIGLYKKKSGNILFANNTLNISDAFAKKQIFFISSNSFLFERTIYENIAYGADNPQIEDLRIAAELAGAHEFISKTPDGYYTLIDQNCTNLSSGQKQRILIARAILCKRDVTILDEVTSHLDEETERLVINNLLKVFINKTLIVITHKPSSLEKFDKILLFNNGEILT